MYDKYSIIPVLDHVGFPIVLLVSNVIDYIVLSSMMLLTLAAFFQTQKKNAAT